MIQRAEPVKTESERVEDALQSLDRVLRSEIEDAMGAEKDVYRRHKLRALAVAAEAYYRALKLPMTPTDG